MKRLAVPIAIAALAVAGCGGSTAPQSGTTTKASAAATPSTSVRPAGCDQAVVVVGTVRGELENAPTDATFQQVYSQMKSLADSLPTGQLKIDTDRANLDIAEYWLHPTAKRARWVTEDLNRIQHECA